MFLLPPCAQLPRSLGEMGPDSYFTYNGFVSQVNDPTKFSNSSSFQGGTSRPAQPLPQREAISSLSGTEIKSSL